MHLQLANIILVIFIFEVASLYMSMLNIVYFINSAVKQLIISKTSFCLHNICFVHVYYNINI